MLVEYGEGGNAFGQRNLVALGDVLIPVDPCKADVDVDNDVVGIEQGFVGGIVEVDIQNLAIAAPVTAEVEEDMLVGDRRGLESCGEVNLGPLRCGIDVVLLSLGGRDGGDEESGEHEWQS